MGRPRFSVPLLSVLIAGALVVLSGQGHADWAEGVRAYERGDYAAALEEWRPLAERGDAQAQAALGSLYIYGNGVELDYAQGLDWTRRAAEQGDVTGLFNMGTIYAEGLGVVQDYEIAARYFRKAAARDDAASRYNLGVMYAHGLGVVRDNIEAVFWLNTASVIAGAPDAGLQQLAEDAERLAVTLLMTMTQAEADEANSRSREWQAEYLDRYFNDHYDNQPEPQPTSPNGSGEAGEQSWSIGSIRNARHS